VARTAIAVLAFCLLSGAVYTYNDVRDADADRAHPKKKLRPIAAGALSERQALIAAVVLAVVALGACAALDWTLALIASGYLVQNVAYSIWLKHIAFVDVGVIASGFLLRVLAGAASIAVRRHRGCSSVPRCSRVPWARQARPRARVAERNGSDGATRAALTGYRSRSSASRCSCWP